MNVDPLKFDMVAFKSTKEVSVKYFLDHDSQDFQVPWFFDI